MDGRITKEAYSNVHGGDIYSRPCRLDFSANINPLGIPEKVAQAACRGVSLSANYPDVSCKELRMALAEREGLLPEQILCGNGAAELIFAAVSAAQPREALLVAPGFAEYEQALRMRRDCRISYYFLRRERGFQMGEDFLQVLGETKPELVFLCTPNNPTGTEIPEKLLWEILKTCKEKKIRLALDLCFSDFAQRRLCAKKLMEEYPQVLILKAFTKTYAMAGLRLGYVLSGDEEFLSGMRQNLQPWNVSLPAQLAGTAALKEEDYVRKARKLISTQRVWLGEELKKLGFTVFDSGANFLFFQGPAGLAEFCSEKGILIRDCQNYRGLSPGYYRIAVRTAEENRELIRVLREGVR